MILIKEPSSLTSYLQQSAKTIGFVPTMGALHEGHLELIRQTKAHAQLVVASIFVNPTQFNDVSDFEKYPVTIEEDIKALEKTGLDILFLPSVKHLYPTGTASLEKYELGFLESVYEGEHRPGHFQGVCQVMSRLLRVVQPGVLLMGQKDYQQCMVVRKLIELIGLNAQLLTMPTIREKDGLAMSSRNKRLTPEQRKNAPTIFHTLEFLRNNYTAYPLPDLIQKAESMLKKDGVKPDYVAIADAVTLEPVQSLPVEKNLVALIAAFQGDVRLIDNMLLNA